MADKYKMTYFFSLISEMVDLIVSLEVLFSESNSCFKELATIFKTSRLTKTITTKTPTNIQFESPKLVLNFCAAIPSFAKQIKKNSNTVFSNRILFLVVMLTILCIKF